MQVISSFWVRLSNFSGLIEAARRSIFQDRPFQAATAGPKLLSPCLSSRGSGWAAELLATHWWALSTSSPVTEVRVRTSESCFQCSENIRLKPTIWLPAFSAGWEGETLKCCLFDQKPLWYFITLRIIFSYRFVLTDEKTNLERAELFFNCIYHARLLLTMHFVVFDVYVFHLWEALSFILIC